MVQQTTNGVAHRLLWDEASANGDVVAELDGALNPIASNSLSGAWPVHRSNAGAASYYLQNGLDDTIGLTDSTGAETTRYRFDAYGNPVLTNGLPSTPLGYRGQRSDMTGLLASAQHA
jgi:hypothetical protein